MLPVAQSPFYDNATIMYRNFSFVDDVTSAHNSQAQATRTGHHMLSDSPWGQSDVYDCLTAS